MLSPVEGLQNGGAHVVHFFKVNFELKKWPYSKPLESDLYVIPWEKDSQVNGK